MPRSGSRRYAASLAIAVAGGAAVAGCGVRTASFDRPPTTPGLAVTAPAATGAAAAGAAAGEAPRSWFTAGPGPTSAAPLPIAAPRPPATPVADPTPLADPTPVAGPPPAPGPAATLRIVQTPIPYPQRRRDEMAAYSLRHYGTASSALDPTVIVLHYTAGGTAASTRVVFAADTTNMGERPGTCAHFVVDQDGTVFQLVPTTVRCRHTIGLNDVAIGIEMVQDGGSGPAWSDRQILDRPAQVGAALALVRSLQSQYGIATTDVIGHGTANAAPQFHDRLGWRNDHGDWQADDVVEFRSRL